MTPVIRTASREAQRDDAQRNHLKYSRNRPFPLSLHVRQVSPRQGGVCVGVPSRYIIFFSEAVDGKRVEVRHVSFLLQCSVSTWENTFPVLW